MKNTAKDLWRQRWLSCMNELTSLDLQRKSWLDRTQTNPHWSFVEFVCCYFDDLSIDDNYRNQLERDWISNQEFETIKSWHQKLNTYNAPNNDNYDRAAILNDPKWLEILKIGLNTKNELAKILSEGEKQILTEEIDYLKYV